MPHADFNFIADMIFTEHRLQFSHVDADVRMR